MARRLCSAALLGFCTNSNTVGEKEIRCMSCSTPYAIADVRDTYGLLESKPVASAVTNEISPFMNGITPLSAIIVSYLQLSYRLGDCVDALDTNLRVYQSIIIGSIEDEEMGTLYRVRFLGWPDIHDVLIEKSGIRAHSMNVSESEYNVAIAYQGMAWSNDARWDESMSVCLNHVRALISLNDRYLYSYTKAPGMRRITIPIRWPQRILEFIKSTDYNANVLSSNTLELD
jgi:hypothetical protein